MKPTKVGGSEAMEKDWQNDGGRIMKKDCRSAEWNYGTGKTMGAKR